MGITVAVAMLAEAREALSSRDYHGVRADAGVAPITRQSGKFCAASMRRACNPALRNAAYNWSGVSAMCDPRSQQRYRRLRACGHPEAAPCAASLTACCECSAP